MLALARPSGATAAPVEPSYPPLPAPPPLRALPAGSPQEADEEPPMTAWRGYADVGERTRPRPGGPQLVPGARPQLPPTPDQRPRALPVGMAALPAVAVARRSGDDVSPA